MESNKISLVQNINRAILCLGFLSLVLTVIFFSNRFFWDEPYYYYNLDLVKYYGWGEEFLRQEWGSAGPLYTAVHSLFLPLTKAKLPYIRFINIGLLVLTISLTAIILQRYFQNNPWNALIYMAIPMTYVCSGIALTEMPAFLFLLASLFLLFEILTKQHANGIKFCLAILAGFLFGIAVTGRQPILVSLFALPFIFSENRFRTKANYLFVALFILSALPLPFYIFNVWHGLLAPKEQTTTAGWAPFHFWLGLGYLALITFIISPRFFVSIAQKYRWVAVVCILLLISINLITKWMYYLPMVSFFYRIIPWSYSEVISSVCASGLIVLGLYYLLSALTRIFQQRSDGLFVFVTLAVLLLAFTSIKITHQYSSRYAFQAIPFVVLQLSRFQKEDYFLTVRIIVGVLVGLISLYTYIG